MGDISIPGLVAALELRALVVGVPGGVARARGVGVVDVAAADVVGDVAVDSKIYGYIMSIWRSSNNLCFPHTVTATRQQYLVILLLYPWLDLLVG